MFNATKSHGASWSQICGAIEDIFLFVVDAFPVINRQFGFIDASFVPSRYSNVSLVEGDFLANGNPVALSAKRQTQIEFF